MAVGSKSKSVLIEDHKAIGERLDELQSLMDRTKVMYEQYFMGILKMPPAQPHRDIERKLRELTQMNIRKTALRYRLVNVTQKFGVYNTYWRRIMRQIEQGKYVRHVARASRRALQRGEDVPDEILASLPKRMRDRVMRDREQLRKRQQREQGDSATDVDNIAVTDEVQAPRKQVYEIDPNMLGDDDLGLDIDALFNSITSEATKAVDALEAKASAKPATPPTTQEKSQPRSAASRPPPTRKPTTPPATRKTSGPPPIPKAAIEQSRRRPPTSSSAAKKPAQSTAGAESKKRTISPPPGMSEEKTRALYKRYLAARKQVGKSTDIPYRELVKTLRKQAPALMKQHKAKSVEFDVAVKNGRVVLKAKPKR